MKRFLIWISVVVLTVVIIDGGLGLLFKKYISEHTLPGDYESVEKVLRNSESDILVLGSSVALNSINTKSVEDSLGMNTFNGGGNGQDFPFFLTMLKAAVNSHVPKMVVLCCGPDAFSSDGLGVRYNFLNPYYGLQLADIDENINKAFPQNEAFMKLTTYQLNTIWFRILLYHFITPDIRGENGHIAKPLPPSFPERLRVHLLKMNEERKAQLQSFIDICKENNIKLMILFTPQFCEIDDSHVLTDIVDQVKLMAKGKDVYVYNDYAKEPFASDSTLFYDSPHININGTKIYTDTIINRLKSF